MNSKIYIITKDDFLIILNKNETNKLNFFKQHQIDDKTKGTYRNPFLLQTINKEQLDWVINFFCKGIGKPDKDQIEKFKHVIDTLQVEI